MDTNKLITVTALLFSSLLGVSIIAWNEIQESLAQQKQQAESRLIETKRELTEIKALINSNMQKTEGTIADNMQRAESLIGAVEQAQSIINKEVKNTHDSMLTSFNKTQNDVNEVKEKTDIVQISQIDNRIIIEPTHRVEKIHRYSDGPKHSNPNSLKAANILGEKLKTLGIQMQKLQEFERKLERYETKINDDLRQLKLDITHPNIEQDFTFSASRTVSFEQFSDLKDKIQRQDRKIAELENQLEKHRYKWKSFDKRSEVSASTPKPKSSNISLTKNAKKCSDNPYSRKFKCIRNLTLEFNNIAYEHKSVRLVIKTPDGEILVNRATENDGGKAIFEINIKSRFLEKGLYDTELYGNRNNKLKDEYFSI